MLYKIFLTKTAEKEYSYLYKTNKTLFERVRMALCALAEDPHQGRPLRLRLKGLWSYRIGMYRIIYSIEHKRLAIHVIDIAHRREAYR